MYPLSLIIFAQPEQHCRRAPLSMGLQDEFTIVITENGIRWTLCHHSSCLVASSSCGNVNPILVCPTNQSLSDPTTAYASLCPVCTRKGTVDGGGGGETRQTYKSGRLSLLNDFNCFPANCNRSSRPFKRRVVNRIPSAGQMHCDDPFA